MNVIIATGVGDFTMDVGSNEPVLEMKQRIANHLGIPVANQVLSVYGIELIDGLDMDDYPLIFEGTRIELTVGSNQLHPEPPEKMLVTLKFSTRMMNLEVDRNETVKALKEKIHIIDNTPIKRITLLFSGIDMKEDH